jgi:hypothetical protein
MKLTAEFSIKTGELHQTPFTATRRMFEGMSPFVT